MACKKTIYRKSIAMNSRNMLRKISIFILQKMNIYEIAILNSCLKIIRQKGDNIYDP